MIVVKTQKSPRLNTDCTYLLEKVQDQKSNLKWVGTISIMVLYIEVPYGNDPILNIPYHF